MSCCWRSPSSALPVYWVLEPDRQAGAVEAQEELFVEWGALLFAPTGDNISAFNCAGCHGGMKATGGVAEYNLTDPATGEVKAVSWAAPALNTIYYRYSEEEVRYILVYGRPFSPMPAWGVAGGGPMNDQQIDTLLAYLKSIQIEREDCGVGEEDPQICPSGHLPADTQQEIDAAARKAVEDGAAATYGEALYNLATASGAYSCARCHTPGWSYGEPGVSGQGAFGWNLTGGAEGSALPQRGRPGRVRQDRVDPGCQVRHAGAGHGSHAGLRQHAHRRADRGDRRIRAELVMSMVAINWEFELRGILTVIMGVAVLMGSVYLVLMTNLGARLGFLVTFAAFAGWMSLMGGIWWIYGIGLKGDDAEWKAVTGKHGHPERRAAARVGGAREPARPERRGHVERQGRRARRATRVRGMGSRRRVRP